MHARTLQLDQADMTSRPPTSRPTPAQATALFETYEGRLRGYVAFRVREPADVDDLVGEVFRRAVAGPIPADQGAWPAWLFRVAHNAVVDHYRRRRFTLLPFAFDRPDDAPGLPERAVANERVRATDRALRLLPGRQRSAIYLRYYEGMEFADVANVLDVPPATARSLVHRGLKRVGAAVRAEEDRDGR